VTKPSCMTCLNALDCPQFNDPWKDDRPCREYADYVSQDYVGRKERLLRDNNIVPGNWPRPAVSVTIIQMYFTDRKSVCEIAEIVNRSHQYVSKIINRSKRIIQNNLKRG
jgi:hypothetical protein